MCIVVFFLRYLTCFSTFDVCFICNYYTWRVHIVVFFLRYLTCFSSFDVRFICNYYTWRVHIVVFFLRYLTCFSTFDVRFICNYYTWCVHIVVFFLRYLTCFQRLTYVLFVIITHDAWNTLLFQPLHHFFFLQRFYWLNYSQHFET